MAAQEKKRTSTEKGTLKSGPAGMDPDPAAKVELEKNLFVWRAPARPFKRRDRDFWTTVLVIGVIFSLILFLVEGVMPVILIISLVFLFYVMSTVEPEKVEFSITNKGVKIADSRTDYNMITRFWFTKRMGHDVVVFETMALPGRLEFVVNQEDGGKIRKILSSYVTEEEASPSSLDRAAGWLSRKLPDSN